VGDESPLATSDSVNPEIEDPKLISLEASPLGAGETSAEGGLLMSLLQPLKAKMRNRTEYKLK